MVMETEWSLERALNLALKMEEDSIRLYTSAQKVIKYTSSKKLLIELIKEEEKHRNKIREVMRDPSKIREIGTLETKIQDQKIVDYLNDVALSPNASYQEILIYAAKREKSTHDYYTWLANRYQNTKVAATFIMLAQEELKHKQHLEKEYDEIILKEM